MKTVMLVLICVLVPIIAIVAFSSFIPRENVSAEIHNDSPITFENSPDNRDYEAIIVSDKETGVNYIVLASGSSVVAMCPRYNANGTLYVDGGN